jgi:hypothetical protein
MKHRLPVPLLLLVFLSVPARAQEKSDKLAKKEEATLATIADELLKLGKFCIGQKALDEARAELDLGLSIAPDSKKLIDERAKLGDKKDKARDGFAAKYAAEKKKAHEKCALALADLVVQCEKDAATEKWEKYLELLGRSFPDDAKAAAKAGAVYFDAYQRWYSAKDAEKLKAGGEHHDGKWLTKAEVAALDREHADWKTPWVLSDEVHELKTIMPLRTARTLLGFVTAYRKFFLAEFEGLWDLRAPSGKLPIVVCETQKDLRERLAEHSNGAAAGAQQMNGAAYYLMTNGTLNPCFVTFEPTDATGKTIKVGVDDVFHAIAHEVTHQIAFEYSKHDYDNSRMTEHQFWSVEALANFMDYYRLEKGKWRLSHPKILKLGDQATQGAFAWCVENQSSLPGLEKFTKLSREKFMTVENYHIAATVGYFLLRGENGKYKKSFVKLLEAVHRVKDGAKTWEESFPGVEWKTLDAEFRRFVAKIKID